MGWEGSVGSSLRSKRFRRVWEQRKTEERGFRYFACAENVARAKKRTVGVPPVILCSRTAQKRLLRTLSGLINGLIAAAMGAFSMLMSEPTAKSNVKRTRMFVLSITTLHYITLHYITLYYIKNKPRFSFSVFG